MWGSKKRSKGVDTLIAEGTELKGSLKFNGSLFVDGIVEGDIHCSADNNSVISIGLNGKIVGDINAPYIVIFGNVDGDVRASQKVELKPGAKVHGDLHYKVIEMNAGAEVNGKMIAMGETQALEHKPSESTSEAATSVEVTSENQQKVAQA